MSLGRGLLLLLCMCCGITLIQAQEDPNCVGSPMPRLIVEQEGRVLPGDANNTRDAAGLSGSKNGQIPGSSMFRVLAGPTCSDGLNWWQVSYGDLIGWTVEGQGTDYWIEPVLPTAPVATSTPLVPTNTPFPTSTPVPAVPFVPPLAVVNRLEIGNRARVISDEGGISRLILRSGPGLSTESLSYVEDDALLTILDGPVDADGYFWWSIETENGRTGWVIEGTRTERALLPLCAFTENRVAFTVNQYLYTSDENGANRCIFDRVRQMAYLMTQPENLVWSPDRQWLTYIDYELFQIRADGSQRIRLTDKSAFYWLDWSLDGKRVVTVDERGKLPQIWTMRADGSLLAVLTTNDQKKLWAGWLADSETLLYVERAPSGGYAFQSVNILTGGFRQIFSTPLTISQPVLSPDKSRLLVSGKIPVEGTGSTYILDTQTGDILLEFPLAFDGFWSPDGTRLISLEADTITLLPLSAGSEPARTTLSMALPLTDSAHVISDWLADGRLRVISNGVFYNIDTLTAQVEQVTD